MTYHKTFEQIIEAILIEANFTVDKSRTKITSGFDSGSDILIANEEGNKAIVQVKTYRTQNAPIPQIKRTLIGFSGQIGENGIYHGLLIINTYIDRDIKEELETNTGISIWDRSSLEHLTKKSPDKRALLESILVKMSNNVQMNVFDEERHGQITNIDDIWSRRCRASESPNNKGKYLVKELENIPAGRENFRQFEEKCEEILKFLFDTDLTSWNRQSSTDDKLHRFDMICRIASTHDFWKELSKNFNSRYILFEFKNYKDEIGQEQIYTTEKYLYTRALRSIGFIISRKGANKNASTAMKGALREQGKLIISLNINQLFFLVSAKEAGMDYNGILTQLIDDFLISISR